MDNCLRPKLQMFELTKQSWMWMITILKFTKVRLDAHDIVPRSRRQDNILPGHTYLFKAIIQPPTVADQDDLLHHNDPMLLNKMTQHLRILI